MSRRRQGASSARPSSIKGRPSGGRSVRGKQPSGRGASMRSRSQQGFERERSPRTRGSRMGQGSQPSLRSVSVSQVARASRGSAPAPRGGGIGRIVGRVVIVLAVLAVLVAGGLAAANYAGFLGVQRVTVSGATHLTDEQVGELAAVPAGSTLMDVDADGIVARLKTNPWIKDATVDRVFPDTLNLSITERSLGAVVDVSVDEKQTVQTWALSDDGVWLTRLPDLEGTASVTTAVRDNDSYKTKAKDADSADSDDEVANEDDETSGGKAASDEDDEGTTPTKLKKKNASKKSAAADEDADKEESTDSDEEADDGADVEVSDAVYEEAKGLLKISDVPLGAVPEPGKTCDDTHVSNALGIVSGLSTDLADQVKYVSASNSESTTLVLDNGVEIAFGDDSSIRDKERVCLELMKEHEGRIAYINVRTVSNPIWRSL